MIEILSAIVNSYWTWACISALCLIAMLAIASRSNTTRKYGKGG
jgi:hypothetical protein